MDIKGCTKKCDFYKSIKSLIKKEYIPVKKMNKIKKCTCGFFESTNYQYNTNKYLIKKYKTTEIKNKKNYLIKDYIKYRFFKKNGIKFLVAKVFGKSNFINQIPLRDKQLDFSPECIVQKYTLFNKTINVIREDLLYCGTKQRAGYDYIEDIVNYLEKKNNVKYNSVIYIGSFNGYGPIATAYVGKIFNLKSYIFLTKNQYGDENYTIYEDKIIENSVQYKKLMQLDANVILCDKWNECYKKVNELKNANTLLIPKGFYTNDFRFGKILIEKIKTATGKFSDKIKRLWVVSGVGLLAICCAYAFTNAKVFAIINSNVSTEAIENIKKLNLNNLIIQKKSMKKFFVPYPTVDNYDETTWNTCIEFGEDGDYIWNTAGDVELE